MSHATHTRTRARTAAARALTARTLCQPRLPAAPLLSSSISCPACPCNGIRCLSGQGQPPQTPRRFWQKEPPPFTHDHSAASFLLQSLHHFPFLQVQSAEQNPTFDSHSALQQSRNGVSVQSLLCSRVETGGNAAELGANLCDLTQRTFFLMI